MPDASGDSVNFRLNGRDVRLEGAPFETTLLNFIRAQGLTGTKEGCAEGDCGACTVAVLEPPPPANRADGPGVSAGNRYTAVNSCLMLAVMAAGLEVWTSEAISQGEELHPVQREMAERGGSQCGYCTPGFVMSLWTEFYREDRVRTGFDEGALVGNLCRCTGYRPIREAAHALGAPDANDPVLERARRAKLARQTLVYDGFYRPSTLEGAVNLLAALPGARVIAGGTDLTLEATTAFKPMGPLVSVEGLTELRLVIDGADYLDVGAAVPLSRLETEFRGSVPMLDALWPWFASRQIRNRATLGGNLGTASPIGDASVVLLALDADVILVGPRGERVLPVADFFTGYRQTALEGPEIVKAVRVPKRRPSGTARRLESVYKVAKRGHDDISTVMAALVVNLDDEHRVVQARFAFGGVADRPRRALLAEDALRGRVWDRAALEVARKVVAREFSPIADFRATHAYRERLLENLLEKFFLDHADPDSFHVEFEDVA